NRHNFNNAADGQHSSTESAEDASATNLPVFGDNKRKPRPLPARFVDPGMCIFLSFFFLIFFIYFFFFSGVVCFFSSFFFLLLRLAVLLVDSITRLSVPNGAIVTRKISTAQDTWQRQSIRCTGARSATWDR